MNFFYFCKASELTPERVLSLMLVWFSIPFERLEPEDFLEWRN